VKNRRVIVSRYGGPEVLQVIDDQIPEPRSGEVRVRILAAGVAWGDILKREGFGIGTRPPFTPGYDIVGTIDKLGAGVGTIAVGQMVAALPLLGGYAEYICLPATELVPVPSGLDPAAVVCLVMNYVVAYQLLDRAARVKSGERILIHSAAGGVGTALLQLGKLAGLTMYGTASTSKHELVATLGGKPIDYRTEDVLERVFTMTNSGVDVVFDPIGGASIRRSYKALRNGGRLVVFGAHSILTDGKLKAASGFALTSIVNLIPDGKSAILYNITKPKYSSPQWCREDLSVLLHLLSQERIKPIVAERIPLGEVARAHGVLEKGLAMGKVVLICST